MGELMDRFKRLKAAVHIICEVLEMIAAALMLVGILFSTFSLITDGELFRALLSDTSSFRGYMDKIFMLVIGIDRGRDHTLSGLCFGGQRGPSVRGAALPAHQQ